MRKSKRFISMPVVSLEEGQKIGTVKGLVVDPAAKKIVALIIEQKGWFKEQRFIPYHRIHSVGGDAITIEKTSGVERAARFPDIVRLLKEKVSVTGAKLVAENGTVLGYVDEYYIDTKTGTIAGLEFSGNFINGVVSGHTFIDIDFVRTLGREVVIINNEGVESVFKLDGGIQERVKNIRESTSHIWGSTVQKTRGIGTSLNKSLDNLKKDLKLGMEQDEGNIFSNDRIKKEQCPDEEVDSQLHENAPWEDTAPDHAAVPPSEGGGDIRKDAPPPS